MPATTPILNWINQTIRVNKSPLKETEIENIKNFALLWNLFEAKCCRKNANPGSINAFIDRKIETIDFEKLSVAFAYFKDRYQNSGRFNALNLSGENKSIAQKVVDSIYTDKNNHVKFIMAVIHRYRNNLFHGEKSLLVIEEQEYNFKIANEVLQYMIEIS